MSSTSSTSSSTLNLTGLVSNTDWQSLVSSINSAQKQAVEGPLNSELTNEQNILSAWQSFNTSLSTITNYISTNNLNSSTGYQSYNASLTCSDSSITPSNVLSASIGTGTIAAGTYAIKVANLATPEQIASDNFSSSSTALGYSGDMLINGKDISVASTDTLGSIAAKINDANAGVSANVLTVSGNQYRLVLQSTSTGTSSMALRDGDASDVLESLNLLNDSTPAFLNASGANALSDSFSSESTPVGISPLLSLTSPQSGSIQIEGSDSNWYSVSVNLKTDSLQTIANNITNAAIPGVTASVVPTTTNGTTTYQLQITNTAGSSPPSMKDSNSILDTLGLYGGTVKNVLQAGQNANLSVDGYNVTSASNTVTGVINGVTLNLTGTNPTTAINLNITADNSGLSSQVSTLVSDISTALAFINSQNTVNSSSASATANVLMGNGNLFTMKNTIVNTLLENIPGNSTYTTAGSIGIDFGNDGSVSLNSDTFDAALSANPTEVQNAIQTLSTDLYKSLNVYVDPTTGTVQSIENSVNSQITNINAQEAQQLDDEYTNLQLLLEQSSQTQNFLTQMFDTMTGTTSSSSSASSL
jgi:flagellar hook-associated protein 2